jgi:CheY-like chemotaxis protein
LYVLPPSQVLNRQAGYSNPVFPASYHKLYIYSTKVLWIFSRGQFTFDIEDKELFVPSRSDKKATMIFLIDDDHSVRRGYELFLMSARMECKSFENANEFLGTCSPGKGDLLILDLNLPGISGFDVLKKFAQDNIHIPVIVVTAFDDPSSRKKCKDYGVNVFLRKPVDGETLIDIIRYNLQS